MTAWAQQSGLANAALLAAFGEPITYIPNKGSGVPIATVAILDKPQIDQSASPGYFADIHIDPLQVTNPARGDQVVWADGVSYVVAKVVRPDPYSLFIAALHRRVDP